MASGFDIGVMFLSCVLYPCLYYMYVYINMAAFFLSVSSQYLTVVCIGHLVQLFVAYSRLIILQSSRYRYRLPSKIFMSENVMSSCISRCSKYNMLYSTLSVQYYCRVIGTCLGHYGITPVCIVK